MKPLALAVLLLAACSSSGTRAATTTTSGASATPSSAVTKTFSSAADVIAAISAGGVECRVTRSSSQAGGGVATLGFCKVGAHRVQVVTFFDDSGKKAWLKAANEIAAGLKGQEYECVVGSNFAACPDPGAGSKDLGARIAAIIGGQEFKSPGA